MAQTETPQSFIITTKARLTELGVKPGQLIFVKDAQKAYYDWDGKRIAYHDIIELDTDSDRTSLQSPISNKIYLVNENYTLWQYRGGSWFQLTNEPQVVFKASPVDLKDGKENTLYIAGKRLYIYDKAQKQFLEIAKNYFVWGTF